MNDTDLQLLSRYTRDRAEDAFTELVRRHLNLVYSAALRQVRSPQLAEEVAQSVFTDLARNAAKLTSGTGVTLVLTAWLYQVTRRTAIDVVRREARRQLREQIATEMNVMNATLSRHNEMTADANDWTHIEPLLDEAMSALDETDRAAVLLRYFENKSLREVGATLGTSDDAAQKRVSRAVERLREFFAKRGVTVGTGGLVVVISANAVQAAPVGLAVTISATTALVGSTIASTATATATKALVMTTLQKTIIGATLAAAIGSAIYEAQLATQLREERQELLKTMTELERERDAAFSASTRVIDDADQLSRERSDLLRLRNEVGMLRRETNEMGRLRNENRDLRAELTSKSAAPAPRPDAVATDYVPRDQWTFMGYAEPESAIRSMHWAFSRGDVQALLASLSPSERALMEKEWAGRSEAEIAEGLRNDSDNKRVSGYRITNREMISDNMMVLTLYQEGRNKEKKIWLERVDSEWKMTRPPRPPSGS